MPNKELLDEVEALSSEIKEQALDLRHRLALSFAYTADVFDRLLRVDLAKLNLNRTTFSILHDLVTHSGSMTAAELSKTIFRSTYVVSISIKALEKEGLVKRRVVRDDHRKKRVSITRKGLDVIKAGLPRIQESSEKLFSILNAIQADELRLVLRQLRKHCFTLINQDNQMKTPADQRLE